MSSNWSEEGTGRRDRIARVRLVNRVLDHFGLRLEDWSGSVYVLRNRTGRTEVVSDVGSLWQAAERLAGRQLDPLAPELVRSLARE